MLTDKCFAIIINADLKYWNRNVHWEDTQKGNKTPLKGDGIPFIIMGARKLECYNGHGHGSHGNLNFW